MARPKIHDKPSDRHAKYRERTANERNEINKLGLQAQDQMPIDEEVAKAQNETQWFKVTINIHRYELDMYGEVIYIMSETELLRLQNDLNKFKTGTSEARHGTYAFADSGQNQTGIPGMTTIAFYGLTVISTSLISDFKPPSTYNISLGAVQILLRQGVRPHRNLLSTIEELGPDPQSVQE